MYTPWGPDSEVRVVGTVASGGVPACAKASLPLAQQTVTTQGRTQASVAWASDFSREPETLSLVVKTKVPKQNLCSG